MNPRYKVGIWGQFGSGKIADGQAVRTNVITSELKSRYGEGSVGIANTNGWTKRPLAFLCESISLLRESETVAILPADKGFMVFAPILTLLNKIWKRRLVYIVIGGFLPALLKKKPAYISVVKSFDVLFVQTENLRNDLREFGIEKIEILSNLKRLNTRAVEDLSVNNENDVALCLLSRIIKEKGVEDAIEAVSLVNEKLGGQHVSLDMYGLLPKEYEGRLSELLEENCEFVRYCGIVDYDKTVETLAQYFALVFPTYYYGEGFPGNVIDAFNTGLPIVATDWLYNKDFIEDGYNGILVPVKNPQLLAEAIMKLYNDRDFAYRISVNNLNEAEKYQPEKVLEGLFSFIDGRDGLKG